MKTLIILHGWQSSKERWQKVKELIEKEGIEVIAPDLPGFKKDTALDRPWNLDDYVEWFEKKYGDINEPFFLLGHSFGGRMAIKFSVKYPEKVLGLILCSAAGIRHKKNTLVGLLLYNLAKILSRFSFLPGFNFFRKIFYQFLLRKIDYIEAEGKLKETFKNIIGEDLTHYLAKIKTKTLLIWGEKDKAVPLSDAYLMKKEIQNSILEIIPQTGHRVNIEVPEKLAEIVLKFLKS